jgi:type I site-specific restriction endonuclease
MLGRGTRLDPKTGKFSFKILDFVGLCQKMEDNGKGTIKVNNKVVTRTGAGGGGGGGGKTSAGIIDNPDPTNLIQRVYLHGDKIKVLDNIPIEKARKIFEEELEKNITPEVVKIKEKVKANVNYEPSEHEIKKIKNWTKNPNVYLDEGQLQKIYDYKQGSIWDFFLHALKIKKIPTPKERVERGFESYIKTYNFNDKQIMILREMKDIVSANIAEKKRTTTQEIFNNPVYARIIGVDYQDINHLFDNRFPQIFEELQTTFKG